MTALTSAEQGSRFDKAWYYFWVTLTGIVLAQSVLAWAAPSLHPASLGGQVLFSIRLFCLASAFYLAALCFYGTTLLFSGTSVPTSQSRIGLFLRFCLWPLFLTPAMLAAKIGTIKKKPRLTLIFELYCLFIVVLFGTVELLSLSQFQHDVWYPGTKAFFVSYTGSGFISTVGLSCLIAFLFSRKWK